MTQSEGSIEIIPPSRRGPDRTVPASAADAVAAPPPRFGTTFSDHMVVASFQQGRGWDEATVLPFGPLALSPAAAGLHYGQSMFEGLKAFRGVDGRVRIFRLDKHCQRMARGAARLCMPALEPADMARAIVDLVKSDSASVPGGRGTSLYLRPTLTATEPFLGVRPSEQYLFFVIASPAGGYFGDAAPRPLRLRVEEKMSRAVAGGLGAVKAAGNYAASLRAGEDARRTGHDQVLWTDAHRHQVIQEAGMMNVFVQIGDEVLTPPLDGTILAGVTRDSVLTLLGDLGVPVQERRITVDEILEARRTGRLREMWGTGTGAGIAAIGELTWRQERIVVGDGGEGPLARRLLPRLQEIQSGAAADPHGWMTEV